MLRKCIHADNQTTFNFWLDLALLALVLAAITSAFVDTYWHKWLGGSVGVAVAIHLVWHWRWIQAIGVRFLGRMSPSLRLKAVLDTLLLIAFLLLIMSGVIVAMIYAPNVTRFHNFCFYTFLGLVFFHLALNWNWLANSVKRQFKFKLKHK
jgi:hypothetical protein